MTGRTAGQPKTYFAKRLREAQSEAMLTNARLARAADISESQLGKYRRGDTIPGLEIATRLARALGRPLDDFAEPEEIAA